MRFLTASFSPFRAGYGDGTADAPPSPDDMCKFSVKTDNLIENLQAGASNDDDIMNYVEGVAAYAAFGLLAALLCIVVAGLYCCGRMCCCCVRGGCCGKRYPTYAMSAFRLGFTEVDAPLLSKGGTKELAYPARSRWMTRICMFIYAIAIAAFVSLGQLRGNQAITTSLHTIADSPTGFMNLIL